MYSRRGWSYSSSVAPVASAYRRRSLGLPRGWTLGPLPVVLALMVSLGWYNLAFDGFVFDGVVLDATTGRPLPDALVWFTNGSATTGPDGAYRVIGLKPPESLWARAPGYEPTSLHPWPGSAWPISLQPRVLDLYVTDADAGAPVDGLLVAAGDLTGVALGAGYARISAVEPGTHLVVRAPGFAAAEVVAGANGRLDMTLAPSLTGQVLDASTGTAVAGARVYVGDTEKLTDEEGRYSLEHRTDAGRLTVLAPGFRRATLDLGQTRGLDVALQPNQVKGAYFTYFAMGHPDFRKRMFDLLDTTELNAVVIDVKGDFGYLAYQSAVPLAESIGANANPTIPDAEDLLGALHGRGVYVIARIVVFKDDLLARNGRLAGLDVAIKNSRDERPWIDGEDLAWVDPFQEAAWEYNVALAREAIERGFDEVQFDYIRFPSDPASGSSVSDARYSRPFTEQNRVEALGTFLGQAHDAVGRAGGFLSVDTFGYATWWEDDGGIGQNLRALASRVDYVSPMVYPSTFSAGVPGGMDYPDVVRRPYDVVYQSLRQAQDKVAGLRAVVRPWIQYFDDYAWQTGARYDASQIEAQKRAAADAQAQGWLLWDASNQYGRGGLAAKGAPPG